MSHDRDALEPILQFRSEIAALESADAVHDRLSAWITEIERRAAGAAMPEFVHVREGVFAEAATRLGQLGDEEGAVAAAIAWSFWSTRATYMETPAAETTLDRASQLLAALNAFERPTAPAPSAPPTNWPMRPDVPAPPTTQHTANTAAGMRSLDELVERKRVEVSASARGAMQRSTGTAFRAIDDAVSRAARDSRPTTNVEFDRSSTREGE